MITKKLLNTLYILNEGYYLSLDGENVVVKDGDNLVGRVPLHNLDSIICMSYIGASPALMGKCAGNNIGISFLTPTGKFLAKVTGPAYGNILLRKQQYRIADDKNESLKYARSFIIGKVYNERSVVRRALRDYSLRLNEEKMNSVSDNILNKIYDIKSVANMDSLRGFEGEVAKSYFSVFDELILQQKKDFKFTIRSRRPPLDPVNAMLSFAYSLLTSMCCTALETVGLDPYAGFMHTDRPGRCSLALDLVEELRAAMADRFVLSLINKKIIKIDGFLQKENGAIIMKDDTRKDFLSFWQNKKQETITHPFLKEKIEWGMLPYVQAQLLARSIRGDIDGYPPFLWK